MNGTKYTGIANFITGAGATFTRASTATYFNGSGTMVTASSGTPPLDHNPASPYQPYGLLIEESRTNLVTYSSDLTHWAARRFIHDKPYNDGA